MARETYITKCMNWETNAIIALYEAFGWELVTNNVVTSINTDPGTNVAAENELTFSREKDMPWYSEVSQLQQEFIEYGNQLDAINQTEPIQKKRKFHWIIFLVLCLFYGVGLIYLAIHYGRIIIYKNKEKQWHTENDPKIAALDSKRTEIMNHSHILVNGGNSF